MIWLSHLFVYGGKDFTMIDIDVAAARSRALFDAGDYYCAESVLLVIADVYGVTSELIPKIATGFCSGVARTCGQCGALSGGILGINLLTGRTTPGGSVEANYAAVQALLAAFESAFGARTCDALLGVDLGAAAGQQAFAAENLRERCLTYVGSVTRITLEILEQVPLKR